MRSQMDGGSNLFFGLVDQYLGDKIIVLLYKNRIDAFVYLLSRICYNKLVRYLKRYSFLYPIYHLLFYKLFLSVTCRAIKAKYSSIAFKGIWTNSNDILPLLAIRLSKEFHCPVHISVFDLPFTFSQCSMERRYLQINFEEWLKSVVSFDFASDNMKSYILARASSCHNANVIWSSPGLPSDLTPGEAEYNVRSAHKNIIIVFCGSVRFRREMRAFADALGLLSKKGKSCEFRIRTSKRSFPIKADWLPYIANHDHLISELKECDFAYSPMEFDAYNRLLAETSFPGKFMDYLEAGLPIIAHAPSYAASYDFVKKNDLGIVIDSIDPEVIATSLFGYLNNPMIIQTQKSNAATASGLFYRKDERSLFFNKLFDI